MKEFPISAYLDQVAQQKNIHSPQCWIQYSDKHWIGKINTTNTRNNWLKIIGKAITSDNWHEYVDMIISEFIVTQILCLQKWSNLFHHLLNMCGNNNNCNNNGWLIPTLPLFVVHLAPYPSRCCPWHYHRVGGTGYATLPQVISRNNDRSDKNVRHIGNTQVVR